MPSTPVNSVTPRGSTAPPCRDMGWPRPYLPASRPTKPCSWPGCWLVSTQWATPCTAGRPPRTPASPTSTTAAWTTWPTQRSTSSSTAIRFTPSIWSSFTDKLELPRSGLMVVFLIQREAASDCGPTHPKCLWGDCERRGVVGPLDRNVFVSTTSSG